MHKTFNDRGRGLRQRIWSRYRERGFGLDSAKQEKRGGGGGVVPLTFHNADLKKMQLDVDKDPKMSTYYD